MATSIPADENTSGFDPTVQDLVNLQLARNGGIGRIQTALQQNLDMAGWSQSVREYLVQLFRSGEAVTFDDAEAKLKEAIYGDSRGTGNIPDLSIPRDAEAEGAKAVKKELLPLIKKKE